MDSEEDDNSNSNPNPLHNDSASSTSPTPTITSHMDPHPVHQIPDTQPQRSPDSDAEVGGGRADGDSLPPPPEGREPGKDVTGGDDIEDQDALAREDVEVAEGRQLEVGEGGAVSQSPSTPVAQGDEGDGTAWDNVTVSGGENNEIGTKGESVMAELVIGNEGGSMENTNVDEETNNELEATADVAEESAAAQEVGNGEKIDVGGELRLEAADRTSERNDEAAGVAVKLENVDVAGELKVEDTQRDNVENMSDVMEETEEAALAAEELVFDRNVESMEREDVAQEMEGATTNVREELVLERKVEDMKEMDVPEEIEEEGAAAGATAEDVKMTSGEAPDASEEMLEEHLENTESADIPGEIQATETHIAEGTEANEETGDAVNETGEMADTEMTGVAQDIDNEEEMEMGEETDVAEEPEKVSEAKEMDMAEETERAEEEASKSAGGKRKRGKNAKAPARISSRKKMEEDVCFICFDGGDLVLCDRRGCPKAYHASCVNRDDAFFQSKGKWNCGWHLCSNCEKNAYYMCYTCTFSLCKGCIKDAVILCVRGNKGFCETCMRTVMMVERNEQENNGMINFDDRSSWEYLFKDYWIDLKEKLSITSEEIAQAKNPWKGSDLGKHELTEELYDAQNDGGSGSDSSSANGEVTASKRRKTRKRLKSRAKDRNLRAVTKGDEGTSPDESFEWASKELLEFVMHMKNGDRSVCSQFDVQALLLEYIKTNKLRDPRRKSQILCDSRLQSLFGKPRVGHFEMLKLLESHFLVKEDSQADDLQESVVDNEANLLEADVNSLGKGSKDKKRKSRKKGDGRGLQSNVDDYAAIDMHNINLIYLKRSLVENLLEDTETFQDKVVGSFVRIRISGSAQKQDLYRLVQVVGTSKAADPYRVGKKTTDFLLEILNLNKTEIVSIDIISNQEFTEDECKRLRQSIRCGFINRLTVGDIQEKALALQAVRVEDWLESETTRLSHLRDRASDMGRRKELRECVEKLQLLKSPEERQRKLEEVPDIHDDPKMDPSYESEEDEGEADDKRQESYLRPRGGGFSRRAREPISPRKGGFTSNDSWGGTKSFSSTNRELTRSISNKGFSNKGDDTIGAGETSDNFWSHGRDKETQLSQSWEKPKATTNSESRSNHSAPLSDSVPRGMSEMSPTHPSTGGTHSAVKINETEKIWHYKDPSGKIQGPFSMVQLRKWNNTGYFPPDLRIWRTNEKQDDSILVTDALAGNFHKVAPLVDSNSTNTQVVHSPHLPSSLLSNAGESWKRQPENSSSTVRATPMLEVPNNSSNRWGSETNLPSPTPARSVTGGAKGQVYDTAWSPTPAQTADRPIGANPFSRASGNLRGPAAAMIPESGQVLHTSSPSAKVGGHRDAVNMTQGVGLGTKVEPSMLLSSANASQMHPQSQVQGDASRIQVNSHMLPVPESNRASVNAAIDVNSLQKLIQPITSNNSLVGTQGWGPSSVSKPDMNLPNALAVSGSQASGSTPSQKQEPSNVISMPGQPTAYGNWGNAPTSVSNSALSFTMGNPTGISPVPVASSDPWRASVPAQANIQGSTPSNMPRGMGTMDSQGGSQRQGPENQNSSWGPIPGNTNMGWGGPVPANPNQGWVAPGQAPSVGHANPGWVAPTQGQAPVNTNPGWVASQTPGNAFQGWGPSAQGSAQAQVQMSANAVWGTPSNPNHGPPPGNANANAGWGGNTGSSWGNEKNHNGDRYLSQRDRGGDSGYGSGNKPWNRQSSFGNRGGGGDSSSRPGFKGQRVCKFHENGHCKKGAHCDYLHT